MVELKTPGEIEAMSAAGALVAEALEEVHAAAEIGVTLDALDELAAQVIARGGGKPAFLDYQPEHAPVPYPGVLCTSVNEVVQHGIPNRYALRDGDVLSVDCGAFVDGWCGDSAFTTIVGSANRADRALIETGERALAAAIETAVPGAKIGDISARIGSIGRAEGYGVLAHHGGHGIGRAMHEDPHIANDGKPGRGMRIRPGLVIAIEPIFTAGGGDDYRTDADGWTVRTADGSRATHSEHTVAITEDGARVLTARRLEAWAS